MTWLVCGNKNGEGDECGGQDGTYRVRSAPRGVAETEPPGWAMRTQTHRSMVFTQPWPLACLTDMRWGIVVVFRQREVCVPRCGSGRGTRCDHGPLGVPLTAVSRAQKCTLHQLHARASARRSSACATLSLPRQTRATLPPKTALESILRSFARTSNSLCHPERHVLSARHYADTPDKVHEDRSSKTRATAAGTRPCAP
jgi:hypothetical protein